MGIIMTAIILILVVSLIAGLLLSYASKVFAVKEDQLFLDLREQLPGANCGGCGYAGCDDYAHALAAGKDAAEPVPCTKCAVGGPAVAAKLAEVLGTTAGNVERQVSFVACNGTKDNAKALYEYAGRVESCKAAKTLFGGSKECAYGCIGLGDCVKVCEFDAIHVVNGVAVVDASVCTACGKCIKTCPQHLISLKPASEKVLVKCSNKDLGKAAMAVCKTSCIACRMCERTCQHDAVHVVDNVAVIDPAKCIGCGDCAAKCPKHAILDLALKAGAAKASA